MADQKPRPLHEVFSGRAQGLMHLLRDRGIGADGATSTEKYTVKLTENGDGSSNLQYNFPGLSDPHGHRDMTLRFDNIRPVSKLLNEKRGPATVLKSEQIGATRQEIDNLDGVSEIEVDLRDLFSKGEGTEKGKESTASAGTSVSTSVSASGGVEGFGEVEASVEAEIHAEYSETDSKSSSSDSSQEDEGSETESIPVGVRVEITETRARTDSLQEITGIADFTHNVDIGRWNHHDQHNRWPNGHYVWESWQQFCDVVTGDGPDNWPLAQSFKKRHAWHADLWALNPLNSPVKIDVKIEGEVLRSYRVETLEVSAALVTTAPHKTEDAASA